MTEFYEIKVKCDNCGTKSKIKLSVGETISDNTSLISGKILGFTCINCSCETLFPEDEYDC